MTTYSVNVEIIYPENYTICVEVEAKSEKEAKIIAYDEALDNIDEYLNYSLSVVGVEKV